MQLKVVTRCGLDSEERDVGGRGKRERKKRKSVGVFRVQKFSAGLCYGFPDGRKGEVGSLFIRKGKVTLGLTRMSFGSSRPSLKPTYFSDWVLGCYNDPINLLEKHA